MLNLMAVSALKKTVADLAVLGEETHCELIRGELLPKAAPSGGHSEAETHLITWLARFNVGQARERRPGGWWIRAEIHVGYASHDVFCHDVAGWRRAAHPAKPLGWPMLMRPDWVCEVLSPGHRRRDRVEKLETLHVAGVPHYWLLDYDERILQVYRHEPAGYLLVTSCAAGETIRAAPFEACELRTGVLFGDEDDEP